MKDADLQKYILEKLDKIDDAVTGIAVDVARNTSDVAYHIKRTDLLEAQVNELQQELHGVSKSVGWLVFPITIIKKLLRIE